MIAELLRASNPDARTVHVDDSAIDFLSRSGVPNPIVQSLTQVGYADWMPLRNHFIAPINALRDLNTDELYLPWFDRQYLTIGGGLNGDPIALDLVSMLMCFIFHDEMHPRDDYLPDDFVLHTPLSYTEFWTGVVSDPDFPVDAYDADQRWGRLPRFPKKAEP